jgi:hypothetical protein
LQPQELPQVRVLLEQEREQPLLAQQMVVVEHRRLVQVFQQPYSD